MEAGNRFGIVFELQEELDNINDNMNNPTVGCTLINLLCKELIKKVSMEELFLSFLSMTKWLNDMIFNNIDKLEETIKSNPVAKAPQNSEKFQKKTSLWYDRCQKRTTSLCYDDSRNCSYVDFRFDSLPSKAQKAAVCLGYNRNSWDNLGAALLVGMKWEGLSNEQKVAASLLGYYSKDWDDLQRKKSPTITTKNNSNNNKKEENTGSSNGDTTATYGSCEDHVNKKRRSNCEGETGSEKRSKKNMVWASLWYVGPMENKDSVKANNFVLLPHDVNDCEKPFLLAKREGDIWLGYRLEEDTEGQKYKCPYCDLDYQKRGFTNHIIKYCRKNMNRK
jgi:hypothetical protein